MLCFNSLKLYTQGIRKVILFTLLLGFVLRIILLFNNQTTVDYSIGEWAEIFLLGTVNDLCFSIISFILFWAFIVFLSNKKYGKPWNIIIPIVLASAFIILYFFDTPLREFNKPLTRIICYLVLWKLVSYSIRTFFPFLRIRWRQYSYYLVMFFYTAGILLNFIAEYLFWNEFGVRYNFIAVDYLVYTNEVIGNFFESYPLIPILSALIVISAGITYLLIRHLDKRNFKELPSFRENAAATSLYMILCIICFGLLNLNAKAQHHENKYVNELQANGCVKFCEAFISNKLDYRDFYTTIPSETALRILQEQYQSTGKNIQKIMPTQAELHKNIVLISIESMSAEYLHRYGNKKNLTPNLDRLTNESLNFNNLYAAGNRTVRGLEALSLCVPPSPGESIIKQKHNNDLFSVGKLLMQKGYTVQFLYGGDSYFDNMKTFFEGNHYQVIDQQDFQPNETTFKTVWGVCDEDIFNKAIQTFNADAAKGKPFFGHIMTVSNHRPFTYPDGHIDIPSNKKTREGGVKYADYALGKFINDASRQAWFKNTVFVITADHCASSAGSTELPLDEYHIPALIYSPDFVPAQNISTLMSQTDIMPTLFGILGFHYISKFYGQDIFKKTYLPRAFAATYEGLGYWEKSSLIVLSPGKRNLQYQAIKGIYSYSTGKEEKNIDKSLLYRAIANYQTTQDVLR